MTQHVEINQALIRKKMAEMKLTMGAIESQVGMSKGRMTNLMKKDTKYRMRLEEVKEVSRILHLPENEVTIAFVDVAHRGRKLGSRNKVSGPKPFQPRPAYPDIKAEVVAKKIVKYTANADTIRRKAKAANISFAKVCRDNDLSPDYIANRLCTSDPSFTLEMLDLIAKNLKCSIASISNIPIELDSDYTEQDVKPINSESKASVYWVDKTNSFPDPKLDPRYRNNPVTQTRRKIEPGGLVNWVKLPEAKRPKESFYITDPLGVERLAFRVEQGKAVIYVDQYIPRNILLEACEQVKAWGANNFGGKGNE